MTDEDNTEKPHWLVRFIRKLFFESGWDFLKAGILAAFFFVWGNFLGLFVNEPREFDFSRGLMGEYFEGYGYLTTAFQHFSDDTEERVPLLFEPPELADVRVCKDTVGFEDTPTGFNYMTLLAARLPKCLVFKQTDRDEMTVGVFSLPTDASEITTVERGGEQRYFCGCPEQVVTEYLEHPDLYPDPPKD